MRVMQFTTQCTRRDGLYIGVVALVFCRLRIRWSMSLRDRLVGHAVSSAV